MEPVLRALLGSPGHGSTPADAWPWLIAFGAAVAVFGALRSAGDLSGFRVGPRCCVARTTGSRAAHRAERPLIPAQ
ncbi:hypothetical protein ACWGE1_31810 [Streptomyces sp. NPDC054932]